MSAWFDQFGFARIDEQLWLGARPEDDSDLNLLEGAGIDAVVSLCQDLEYDPDHLATLKQSIAERGFTFHNHPSGDCEALITNSLTEAVEKVRDLIDRGQNVYLHCRAGWQRSAGCACAVIALNDGISLDEALQKIQAVRPQAQPLPHQWEGLIAWFQEYLAAAVD